MQMLTQDKSTRDIVPHSLTRLKDTTSKTQKASEQPRRVSTLLKGLIRRYINHKITTYYKTNYTKDLLKHKKKAMIIQNCGYQAKLK